MRHLLPTEAHALLQREPAALLIDCRSDSEFFFVGHPVGAMHVAWVDGEDWTHNPHFVADVRKLAGDSAHRPVLLICRSGNRSVEAAQALEAAGFDHVYNVLHGFEGELDERRQRGNLNGWRFDGLPWEQS